MASRLVTCPETGHLERIEFQVHHLGLLIDACSRFCRADRVDCPRTCAARLDRGRKEVTSVETPRAKVPEILEVRSLLRAKG